jgi:dihydrodipicolinate synthase/N-acetylneuraminate lyase
MNFVEAKRRLEGCYVTIPTIFDSATLNLNLKGIGAHVEFLLKNGLTGKNATFLAAGAAGDFSTMSFDERSAVAEAVVAAAGGKAPVAVGAQTTSTRELVRLAQMAERVGADFIQVSCPFYFNHTEDDFYHHVKAAAEAADIGIIVYNTFWTSSGVSIGMMERLAEIPSVVGLKWAAPRTDAMEFEDMVSHFHEHLCIIDNNLMFAASHMMGARGFEVHLCNYWPQWGAWLIESLEAGRYPDVQRALVQQVMPFYKLWMDIERNFTSGDGYLDKLCMELVGLEAGRCRPPTRDVRELYRERARQMMLDTGVPNVIAK